MRPSASTFAGARAGTASNTCVFALSRASEGVQARGASAWVLCGYWGVRWCAAEGKGRLDDGDHKVVVPLLSD